MPYNRPKWSLVAAALLSGAVLMSGGAAIAAEQADTSSAEQLEPSQNSERMSYDNVTRKQRTDNRSGTTDMSAPSESATPYQDAGTAQGSDFQQ